MLPNIAERGINSDACYYLYHSLRYLRLGPQPSSFFDPDNKDAAYWLITPETTDFTFPFDDTYLGRRSSIYLLLRWTK